MKVYGALIGTLLGFGILCAWALTSPAFAAFAFETLSKNQPFSYRSLEGTLWEGVKLEKVQYKEALEIETFEISLDLSALLWLEVRLRRLEVLGLWLDASLLESQEEARGGIALPFQTFYARHVRLTTRPMHYHEHTLARLDLQGSRLSYEKDGTLLGALVVNIQSSLGSLDSTITLEPKEAKGYGTLSLAIPAAPFQAHEAITFELSGTPRKIAFSLHNRRSTLALGEASLPLTNLAVEGTYLPRSQQLEATLRTTLASNATTLPLTLEASLHRFDLDTLKGSVHTDFQATPHALADMLALFSPPLASTLAPLALQGRVHVKAQGSLTQGEYTLFLEEAAWEQMAKVQNIDLAGTFDTPSGLLAGTFSAKATHALAASEVRGDFSLPLGAPSQVHYEVDATTALSLPSLPPLHVNTHLQGALEKVHFSHRVAPFSMPSNQLEINVLDAQGTLLFNEARVQGEFDLHTQFAHNKQPFSLKGPIAFAYDAQTLQASFAPSTLNTPFPLEAFLPLRLTFTHTPHASTAHLAGNGAHLEAKTTDFAQYDLAFHLEQFPIEALYALPDWASFSTLGLEGKGSVGKRVSFATKVFLDATSFEVSGGGTLTSLEGNVRHESAEVAFFYTPKELQAQGSIASLEAFEEAFFPLVSLDPLGLKGALEGTVRQDQEGLRFSLSAPVLGVEAYEVADVHLQGNLREKQATLERFSFAANTPYYKEHFALVRPGHVDIETLQGSLDFGTLALHGGVKEKGWGVDMEAKKFPFSHPSLAQGVFSGTLGLLQTKEALHIHGEVHADTLDIYYKASGLSIHTDRDIIIITSENQEAQKDFFTEYVTLDLTLFLDALTYRQNGIDLGAQGVFYLKKSPQEPLQLFGSLYDIEGSYAEFGKSYQIARSNLYFRGLDPIDPVLDVHALYKHTDADITIRISGTQSNPRIYLSSNPIMTQQDILSILIFGTRLGGSGSSLGEQHRASQVSLFLVNELSKDYAKELGLDVLYFEYDPTNEYIETVVGKNLSTNTVVLLKNKFEGGEAVLQRQLTDKWNAELGARENAGSLDFVYKKRY